MKFGFRAQRFLDFDTEVRPLGWYGGDWVHKEVTIIAWSWMGESKVTCLSLSKRHRSATRMLEAFTKAYNQADVVVGHWIRGFDLPLLQMAMVDNDLPLLGAKLTHDTKENLIKFQGISKSQQNLASFLGIDAPKIGMTMQEWREANRLTRAGVAFAKERAIGDVVQNKEMHRVLVERGLLGPPKLWLPGTSVSGDYTP